MLTAQEDSDKEVRLRAYLWVLSAEGLCAAFCADHLSTLTPSLCAPCPVMLSSALTSSRSIPMQQLHGCSIPMQLIPMQLLHGDAATRGQRWRGASR